MSITFAIALAVSTSIAGLLMKSPIQRRAKDVANSIKDRVDGA